MKKTLLSLTLLCMVVTLFMGAANASTTVAFGDDAMIWPGQGNGSAEDSMDVVGNPDILGGNYTISGTMLQSIQFKYTGDNVAEWWSLVPSDLFIDTDANGTWDYVAVNRGEKSSGYWDVYSIDVAIGSHTDYMLVLDTGPGVLRDPGPGWEGWTVRTGHGLAIKDSILAGKTAIGSIYFDGWDNLSFNGEILWSGFDFTNLNGGGLDVGPGDWAFGWTSNCANDVIYETGSNEVPIPGAMWLLGSGLLCLIGARKRFKK